MHLTAVGLPALSPVVERAGRALRAMTVDTGMFATLSPRATARALVFVVWVGTIATVVPELRRGTAGRTAAAAMLASGVLWTVLVTWRAVQPWIIHAILLLAPVLSVTQLALSPSIWQATFVSLLLVAYVAFLPLAYRPPVVVVLTAASVVALFAIRGLRSVPLEVTASASTTCVIVAVIGLLAVHSIERQEVDPLTGLLNRRGLDRVLSGQLEIARRLGSDLTVAMIDLDGLAAVNARLGTRGTDALLRSYAGMLRKNAPLDALLGHLGAGCFVVVLPRRATRAAAPLVDRLRRLLPHDGTASAGLSGVETGDSGSLLLGRAQTSLHRAKVGGRNRTDGSSTRGEGDVRLRRALEDGEFAVVYQPIVRLDGLVPDGVEALVRWDHPLHGRQTPDRFLAAAEASGLIHELGAFVLDDACGRLADSRSRGSAPTMVCVNVSGAELNRPGYADSVLAVLDRHGLGPDDLVVEVSESATDLSSPCVLGTLAALHDGGVRVALDDFGAGYSTLHRLANLPIDILKLDKSLLLGVERRRREPVLRAVAGLAEGLGLDVVVEGVETDEHMEFVTGLHYRWGQGYLFGRPEDWAG